MLGNLFILNCELESNINKLTLGDHSFLAELKQEKVRTSEIIYQMRQEQIRVTISKIHNWSIQNQPVHLDIEFYSKQSQYLITRKHIESMSQNNVVEVGISLKIRYPVDQNIIVIAVKQTNQEKHDIGQVQIDLEKFKEGGTKYVAFGGFQKIMQLEVKGNGQPNSQNRQISMQERRVKNKQFILERQKFLQQYTDQQNKLKQQFEQRITTILSQKPRKLPIREYHPPRRYNQYEQFEIPEPEINTKIPTEITTKSAINNDNVIEYPVNMGISHIHTNTNAGRYTNYNINSIANGGRSPQARDLNSPRKHKLILNTLNIVSNEDGSQ